jgi:hypothetical protein
MGGNFGGPVDPAFTKFFKQITIWERKQENIHQPCYAFVFA